MSFMIKDAKFITYTCIVFILHCNKNAKIFIGCLQRGSR